MAATVSEYSVRVRKTVVIDTVTAGSTQDLTLIVDFLAAYLFPSGERHIEEFMASGMSLGGQWWIYP